jgi:L-ribulokinase
MGTSTCHVMNSDVLAEVPGMCGVVEGGITPGLWGYEAGQSGVGDIFGWFVDHFVAPRYHEEASARGLDLHGYLSELAGEQDVGEHGLIALDWESGNRSVLVDHELSGLIVGLTLSTRPEDVYRALIEATAFGTRTIIEAFEREGVPVREFFAAGGLIRNAVIMQIYADVLRRPLHLIDSEQGPALGAAIHAAVAAGAYEDIHAAAADVYDELFAHYTALHDHFGRGGDDVMHRIRHLRRREPARD